MELWSRLLAWLGLRPESRRRPSQGHADDAPATAHASAHFDDSDDIEITVEDVVGDELLRDLSHGLVANTFASPIVDELAGKLRVSARRTNDDGDRALLSALLRIVNNDGIALPTMPKAIVPIQKMLGAPDVDIVRLSAQLRMEPAIATRVVAIANSSVFGGQGQVSSVEDAVVRLGLVQTRNIIMAITARSRLFRMPGRQSDADYLYEHALASAVAGKIVAERTGCFSGEEAFIACLLSELGRIVIFAAAGDLIRRSRGTTTPTDKALAEISNDVHGPVSALIAESWQFDVATVSAIQYHHHPSSAPPAVRPLSQLMYVADDLAAQAIHPLDRCDISMGLAAARKSFGIQDSLDELKKQTRVGFEELERLIAQPARGQPPIRGKAV